MPHTCGGCGNQEAYRTVSGVGWEVCNKCDTSLSTCGNLEPDVYCKVGEPEDNLPDDPRTGKQPVFNSKREMADFLKARKLVQVRDRERGGVSIPPSFTGNKSGGMDRTSKSWHQSRMQIKHLRDMGIDRRRQAYLKAVKGL